MTGQVIEFPADVFSRWRTRIADGGSVDPRADAPCAGDDCQTFAWRGYDGLCGWCFETTGATTGANDREPAPLSQN